MTKDKIIAEIDRRQKHCTTKGREYEDQAKMNASNQLYAAAFAMSQLSLWIEENWDTQTKGDDNG